MRFQLSEFFDWMLNIIKSEYYFRVESIILETNYQNNESFKIIKSA